MSSLNERLKIDEWAKRPVNVLLHAQTLLQVHSYAMGTVADKQLLSKQESCKENLSNEKKEKGDRTLHKDTQQQGAFATPSSP